jgi:hypothetical protein
MTHFATMWLFTFVTTAAGHRSNWRWRGVALASRRAGRPDHAFRIQFFDGSARVIQELHADARNAGGAIALVRELTGRRAPSPSRVLDLDGREVHSSLKGDTKG